MYFPKEQRKWMISFVFCTMWCFLSIVAHYLLVGTIPHIRSTSIEQYNIKGIEVFAKEMDEKGLGKPKVSLQFELNPSGITQLIKAEAAVEEIVIVEEEEEVDDDEDEETNATETADETAADDADKKDEKEADDKDEKADSEKKEEESAEGEAKSDEPKPDEKSEDKEESPKKKKKKIIMVQKVR